MTRLEWRRRRSWQSIDHRLAQRSATFLNANHVNTLCLDLFLKGDCAAQAPPTVARVRTCCAFRVSTLAVAARTGRLTAAERLFGASWPLGVLCDVPLWLEPPVGLAQALECSRDSGTDLLPHAKAGIELVFARRCLRRVHLKAPRARSNLLQMERASPRNHFFASISAPISNLE